MFSAVGYQIGGLTEGFSTHRALMGFLSGVYVCVLLHVRLLVEPLSAVLAGVGPGVGVDEEVGGEGGGSLEALPTLLALECPLGGVGGAVLAEADLVAERLVAQLAGEGPPPAVRPPRVHLQAVRGAEHLVAFHARVRVHSR